MPSEELGFEGKTMAILPDGAAVDEQDRRIAKSRIEGRGLGDESFNLEAVGAPEMNFFRFSIACTRICRCPSSTSVTISMRSVV